MIDIILIRDKDCDELNVVGHANYKKKGKDIVCASVSALIEYLGFTATKMNEAIGKPCEQEIEAGATVIVFNKPDINILDDKVSIKTNKDINNYGYYVAENIVITSAIDTLGRISKEYPEHVSFKIYVEKEKVEPDAKEVA